jgi:hypothetical protein
MEPAAKAAGFLFEVRERSEPYERGGAWRSSPDEVLRELARSGYGKQNTRAAIAARLFSDEVLFMT